VLPAPTSTKLALCVVRAVNHRVRGLPIPKIKLTQQYLWAKTVEQQVLRGTNPKPVSPRNRFEVPFSDGMSTTVVVW
jgi:hypothetical protein